MAVQRLREYNPAYHPEELLKRMEAGKLNIEIIAEFDISEKTFYKWIKDHEEFKEAYERGLPKAHAAWIQKGQHYMEAEKDKPFRYWIGIMNNKFGWAQDAKAGAQQTGGTTNIYIDKMNVLQSKNKDELLDIIAQKLNANKAIPAEFKMLVQDKDQEENNG